MVVMVVALLAAPLASAQPKADGGVLDAGVADAGAADAGTVVAAAPTTVPEPEIPKSEPPELGGDLDYGATLLRTFVVLGVVIAGIYLVLNHGLRRMMGIAAPNGASSLVQVVDRVVLDQKQKLYVVKAGGEYLLVGGTDAGLSLLSKLDAAEVEKLRASRPTGPTLSPLLQKLLGRKPPPPAAPGGNS